MWLTTQARKQISIHAPLTGSDVRYFNMLHEMIVFQSTLPSQGATCPRAPQKTPTLFQSTLPSQGATDDAFNDATGLFISIHAPLTGSDDGRGLQRKRANEFQSTLPSQGATNKGKPDTQRQAISIHAPLTGSDKFVHYL